MGTPRVNKKAAKATSEQVEVSTAPTHLKVVEGGQGKKGRKSTSTPEPEQVRERSQPKKLDFSLRGLLGLIKEVRSIVEALEVVWGPEKENRDLMRNLVYFAEAHAVRAAEKRVPSDEDRKNLRRTVRFADRVAGGLASQLYSDIRGWEERHTGSHRLIAEVSSVILEEQAEEITRLHAELKAVLADSKTSYMEVARAYRAVLNHLGEMQKRARVEESAFRRQAQLESEAEVADEVLDELEILKQLLT